MPSPDKELSIDEIIDKTKDDLMVINPTDPHEVVRLKQLFREVTIKRRAVEIVIAIEELKDSNKAADIAVEAKKAGIDPNQLKAACKAERKWYNEHFKRK